MASRSPSARSPRPWASTTSPPRSWRRHRSDLRQLLHRHRQRLRHAGYDFDHSSNVSDHSDNTFPASMLQREIDRWYWPARAINQVVWPTCSDHLSCCNNNHREEQRYNNRDHQYDNTSKSSKARKFCHHRPYFHPKISEGSRWWTRGAWIVLSKIYYTG